jgi:uncharacterized membrane protein YhhN
MFKRILAIIILLTGLVYIFVSAALVFKLIPMCLILLYAYLHRSQHNKRYFLLIFIGLFFCALGDALLKNFVVGLSAFLIGHLFYIAAFITRWKFSWIRLCTIVPILIYAGIIATNLNGAMQNTDNEGLIIPVMIYLFIILSMGWFSMMTGNVWSMLGSTLFIISDSILAWNKFISHVSYSGVLIMLTYYTAQFLIARSVSVSKTNPDTKSSTTNSLSR